MKKIVLLLLLMCAASPMFATTPQLMCQFQPQGSATTGNGSNQTIYTCAIPQGDIGSDTLCFDYKFVAQHSGSSSVAYSVKFMSTTVLGTVNSSTTDMLLFSGTVCPHGGLDQFFFTEPVFAGTSIVAGVSKGTSSENTQTGTTLDLVFQFNVASPDTVQGFAGTVFLSGSHTVFP